MYRVCKKLFREKQGETKFDGETNGKVSFIYLENFYLVYITIRKIEVLSQNWKILVKFAKNVIAPMSLPRITLFLYLKQTIYL